MRKKLGVGGAPRLSTGKIEEEKKVGRILPYRNLTVVFTEISQCHEMGNFNGGHKIE